MKNGKVHNSKTCLAKYKYIYIYINYFIDVLKWLVSRSFNSSSRQWTRSSKTHDAFASSTFAWSIVSDFLSYWLFSVTHNSLKCSWVRASLDKHTSTSPFKKTVWYDSVYIYEAKMWKKVCHISPQTNHKKFNKIQCCVNYKITAQINVFLAIMYKLFKTELWVWWYEIVKS